MGENENLSFKPETWIKLGTVFLLMAVVMLIHWLDSSLYSKIGYLLISGDIDAIAGNLRSYGVWAMAVSIVINILINILGFLPSIFISAANAVVFGIVPGIIISWLAESVGVIISFLLMRKFLRKFAEKLIAKNRYLEKIDTFSGANGFKMMLAARSIPYFPSGIVTALGAVSSIGFKDYALATLIGKFPPVVLEVLVGHDIVNYEQNMARLSIVTVLVLLIYCGLWCWKRQRGRQSEKTGDSTRL